MTNSPDEPPKKPSNAEVEIRQDGSTMERFESLTRRLLGVSKAEVKVQEEEWKKARRKKRATKRKTEKTPKE